MIDLGKTYAREYLMVDWSGNPMAQDPNDLICVRARLAFGDPLPKDWRVLTGNSRSSLVAIVCYRYELTEAEDASDG